MNNLKPLSFDDCHAFHAIQKMQKQLREAELRSLLRELNVRDDIDLEDHFCSLHSVYEFLVESLSTRAYQFIN